MVRSTAKIAVALVAWCACDAGVLAPVGMTSQPPVPTGGPEVVGADPRPEPTLLPASHAPVIGLTTGRVHSCALHDDGHVSCWGSSSHGQLGVADPDHSSLPIGIAVTDVVEISADYDATCARQRSGRIVCWGQFEDSSLDELPRASEVGDAVQLSGACARTITGDVRCVDRGLYAVEVPIHDATKVAARHGVRGCAIVTGGAVKCWNEARTVMPVDHVRDAVELAIGWSFACARTASGVWCWDFDHAVGKPYALGITGATALTTSPGSLCVARGQAPIVCLYGRQLRESPHELKELAERPVTALALGDGHSCALTDGRVMCWGDNFDGEAGTGTASTTARARRVPGLDDVEELVAAGESTCVRHRDGAIACFGELPVPPSARKPPKPCPRARHDLPTQLLCSEPAPMSAVPVRVDAMPSSGLCAITDGALSCRNLPFAGTHDLVAVSTSDGYTCALGRDGTTTCFHTYNGTPLAMPLLDHARAIALTEHHQEPELCALRDDDTVACVTQKAPTPVVRARGVVALASNQSTTCVVLTDGRAGCWGLGTYGILGNGRSSLADRVAYVRGLAGAVKISVGRIHACALLGDGGVACWGYGAYGQTGIQVYKPVEPGHEVTF